MCPISCPEIEKTKSSIDYPDQDPRSARILGENLRDNSIVPSPIFAPSNSMGVVIETLIPGDGRSFPQKGDRVTMHYVGTLNDGSKFDSSRDRGHPFVTEIGIGKVIKGWDEAVPQLSLGQKARLVASADYAYGSRGFPPVIPPNSTLTFEVELLKIN
ncbi:hypothetical protein IW261DRAFT_1506521 [Armillaria novae-zelandiae]|uniref:peptidylprolyl isomerase n=1 Tax=Armillaria novae-zelandiae TaxID=153914 RepID=A0AA39NVP5_9AGAR|nr:hypothetical protein IW261DRAFT_1506521 [Armillaria novae-zelandiae]